MKQIKIIKPLKNKKKLDCVNEFDEEFDEEYG